MFARNLKSVGTAATFMAGFLVGCSDSPTDVAAPDSGATSQLDGNGVKGNEVGSGPSTNLGSLVSSFKEGLHASAEGSQGSTLPAVPADAEVLEAPAEEMQSSSLPKVPADEGPAESVAVDKENTVAADNNDTLSEGLALNPLLPKTEQDFKSPYVSNDIELSFNVAGKKIDISSNSKEYQHSMLAKGLRELCVRGNVQHIELTATDATLSWKYTQVGSEEGKQVSVELLYPGHFQYFDWINATGALAVSLMGTEGNKTEIDEQIVKFMELWNVVRSPVTSYDGYYKKQAAKARFMPGPERLTYDRIEPAISFVSALRAQAQLENKNSGFGAVRVLKAQAQPRNENSNITAPRELATPRELGYYAGFMNAEEEEMLLSAYGALEQFYRYTPVCPSELLTRIQKDGSIDSEGVQKVRPESVDEKYKGFFLYGGEKYEFGDRFSSLRKSGTEPEMFAVLCHWTGVVLRDMKVAGLVQDISFKQADTTLEIQLVYAAQENNTVNIELKEGLLPHDVVVVVMQAIVEDVKREHNLEGRSPYYDDFLKVHNDYGRLASMLRGDTGVSDVGQRYGVLVKRINSHRVPSTHDEKAKNPSILNAVIYRGLQLSSYVDGYYNKGVSGIPARSEYLGDEMNIELAPSRKEFVSLTDDLCVLLLKAAE